MENSPFEKESTEVTLSLDDYTDFAVKANELEIAFQMYQDGDSRYYIEAYMKSLMRRHGYKVEEENA